MILNVDIDHNICWDTFCFKIHGKMTSSKSFKFETSLINLYCDPKRLHGTSDQGPTVASYSLINFFIGHSHYSVNSMLKLYAQHFIWGLRFRSLFNKARAWVLDTDAIFSLIIV